MIQASLEAGESVDYSYAAFIQGKTQTRVFLLSEWWLERRARDHGD